MVADNVHVVYYLFNLTAGLLYGLSLVTGQSYELWNVLIWFVLIPGVWLYFISRKTTPWLNLLTVAGVAWVLFSNQEYRIFNWSVVLLEDLARMAGSDYRKMSVYICVLVPIIITILIVLSLGSKQSRRRLSLFLIVCVVLTTVGYFGSNMILHSPRAGEWFVSLVKSITPHVN